MTRGRLFIGLATTTTRLGATVGTGHASPGPVDVASTTGTGVASPSQTSLAATSRPFGTVGTALTAVSTGSSGHSLVTVYAISTLVTTMALPARLTSIDGVAAIAVSRRPSPGPTTGT